MSSTANTLSNLELAELLTNIATVYKIKRQNHFETVAYENAADTVISYPKNIHNLWQKDPASLDSIPNIGPGIAKKIDYYFKTKQFYPSLKPIFAHISPVVFTFTKINGVGPLTAYKLSQHLKFSPKPAKALDQLLSYAQKGKIRNIPTLGKKSETVIYNNTLAFLGRKKRLPLSWAKKFSAKIINFLNSKFPKVTFIPLGSLRRQSPSVGDIDIAGAAKQSKPILDHFVSYPDTLQIIARGSHKASIRLPHDIHIDLMIKPPASFGALLQHFTGSRQHNIILRKHALKLGYSLSEYGIRDLKTKKLYRFDTEEKFYRFLKLKYIPPPKRLGENELDKYQMV